MGPTRRLAFVSMFVCLLAACASHADQEGGEPVGQVVSALSQSDTLTLTSSSGIDARRTSLITFVWGQSSLPTTVATPQALSAICSTSGLPTLNPATELRIGMLQGQEAFACHLRPVQSNGRLVILHHGHACSLADGTSPFFDDNHYGLYRTMYHLLNDGFGVLFVYMPRFRPGDCPGSANPHLSMVNLQPSPGTGSSLQYFLTGTLGALNYVQNLGLYQEFNMVGLSGGGWTTAWYAALDTRIKMSFVLSGAMPFQFWPPGSDSQDEQTFHGYYDNRTGYRDLFIMGAHGVGRRQIHVLRRNDTCCFSAGIPDIVPPWNLPSGTWADNVHAYEAQIRNGLVNMGSNGMFRVEIDDTNTPEHTISRNTVTNVVLSELEGARRHVGAADAADAFARGANGNLWRLNSSGVWGDTGLAMVGVPAVLHVPGTGQHSIDVFYRDRENRLMRGFPNAQGVWTSAALSGTVISDPATISRGSGLWDVVAFGGDYRLYRWSSGFSGIESVSSTAQGLGTPSLITSLGTPSSILDIFFRGLGDGVYTMAWNGSTWSNDATLQTGAILGFPNALPSALGTQRVYALGHDGQLYENSKLGPNPWNNWSSISAATGTTATKLGGSPSVHPAGGTIAASVRALSGNLVVFALPGSSWTFTNAGGTMVGTPTRVPTGSWVQAPANNLWFNGSQGWISRNGWFE
jgi:hypothetical protein